MNTTKLPGVSLGQFDVSASAQQILYRKYGLPMHEHFYSTHIMKWGVGYAFPWFPVENILIHRDFAKRLNNAFKELEQRGLHKEIISVEECYALRKVTGSPSAISIHSWGCAIDMNSEQNHIGTSGTWTTAFLEVMLLNGVFCGQNWQGRKVPNHFAMVNG